jgi:hypothetical protein
VIGQLNNGRIERSLSDIRPVQGGFESTREDVTINGRVFRTGSFLRAGTVVFANKDNCDLFESWIGEPSNRDDYGTKSTAKVTFEVLGDGQLLYKSPTLSVDDPAQKISVSIKGYSGITLKVSIDTNSVLWGWAQTGLWAEPVFIQLPKQSAPSRQGSLGIDSVRNNQDSVIISGIRADGPAFMAGIRLNDTLLAINEKIIESNQQLRDALKGLGVGTKVPVRVMREGKIRKFEVTLGAQ